MKELTLYLDGIKPDQLSLRRLTDYLRELSTLYGSEDAVHFDAVKEGSAQLMSLIEDNKYPKVLNHVREVAGGLGSKKARDSYQRLSDLMAEDKVDGSLRSGGAQILQFPKVKLVEAPLRLVKPSSIQGRLYSVGGKDESVPVRIEGANGETLNCESSIETAEKLAQYLFKSVRVNGNGEWERRSDGSWRLIKLIIDSFTKLEDIGFRDAITRLKAAGGSRWDSIPNAHSEILKDRG
ncbi:hypothetical protein [Pseudomonas sp. B392_1p]|uniref:hypothetical protein n=1 Tax=Pseudomonas sp. B392_1p TaxID=3457507 RepID=UPI003FD4CD59